ncbi:MAG TPA: nickel pincer cofactor biosynthesis protein LarB [Gemmatimonadaceae bacterium]|jgi:hypothetical protein
MIRERVRALLEDVAAGRASIDQALSHLDAAPAESLGFATIDHHRALRAGYPEVVFGEGKTVEQVVAICERLAAQGDGFLVTRAGAETHAALASRFPAVRINALARTAHLAGTTNAKAASGKAVLIVTAGTSDLPVAEEAAETLGALGAAVARLTDVGVAGIHRLLAQHEALRDAAVVIVVAGMDGALPSVVGGLVRTPVIAVPTSVGYGASFEGLSALLTMLNSCAAGVTVCNIDNGFGAAMAAARILGDR